MATTTEADHPTHLEITATGDGYRAVILAEITVFSASLQDAFTRLSPDIQASRVRAYFGLRCKTVESVRAIVRDSPERPQ
ncbi:hypothetical protein [Nocardia yamanashiensis]|uniref:hypothetical protein n=1 Tax=Nocardia yamanashiensis TaxID=209247 RepID=UPI00083779DD|nr:hypothetical protein [Nocardia yamanashiensis]